MGAYVGMDVEVDVAGADEEKVENGRHLVAAQ